MVPYRFEPARAMEAQPALMKAELVGTQHTTSGPERAYKQADCIACVERMFDRNFPAEMLLAVLEAAIRSERLQWRATAPESLDAAVDDFFAWPSALDPDLRTRIRRVAGRALLGKAIIELPADFTNGNDGTTDLVLPLAIMGNEQDIRHLNLEIKLSPRSPACQAQLNKACRGIGPLSSRIPKLEVFVVSLVLERDEHDRGRLDQSFDLGNLDLRNYTSFKTTEDLKTTLERLLEILYAKGPGRHKWVRFIDWRKDFFAHAGPLVRVPDFVVSQAQDGSGRIGATDSATGDPSVGQQVLGQAYRYHHKIARRWK